MPPFVFGLARPCVVTLSLGFCFGLYLSIINFGLNSSLSLTWAFGLGLNLSAIFGLAFAFYSCATLPTNHKTTHELRAPESHPRHL